MILYIVQILLNFLLFHLLGSVSNKFLLKSRLHWTDKNILGVAISFIIIGIVQIFTPVNLFLTISLIAVLLLFSFIFSKDILKINITRAIWFLISALILFPIFNKGIAIYDHYLYHDQAIAWMNTCKLPIGLGNLHSRFAYNNSTFPILASFQMDHKSNWHFFNIFIYLLLLFKSISVVNNYRNIKLFFTLLFMNLGTITYGLYYLSNSSPDFQSLIFALFILIQLIELKLNKTFNGPFFMIITTFLVTIKLNLAIFAFTIFVLAFYYTYKINKKASLVALITPLSIILIWFSRSIIISGQAIYPLPAIHQENFEHSLTKKQAESEYVAIAGWAQHHGEDYSKFYHQNKGTLNWVPYWYQNHFNHTFARFPVIGKISIRFFALFSIFVTLIQLYKSFKNKDYYSTFIVLGLVFNLVFWFFNGPDYRFGYPIFLMLFLFGLIHLKMTRTLTFLFVSFFILTMPFQIKSLISTYLLHFKELNINALILPKKIKSNAVKSNPYVMKSSDGQQIFNYFMPKEVNQSDLSIFPSLPYPVNNITFKKDKYNRFVFYPKIK